MHVLNQTDSMADLSHTPEKTLLNLGTENGTEKGLTHSADAP
jgi:hypothetical protein